MTGQSKDYPRRLLEWWVTAMQSHALTVVLFAMLSTSAVLLYCVRNFTINVDTGKMISEKLAFRKVEDDFSKAFPQLSNTIVIVLDGDTAERATWARKRLSSRLKTEKNLFKTVEEPGGGSFFDREGLLYLDIKELEDFGDTMAGAQPFFALLSRDLSLRGLLSVVEKAMTQTGGEMAQDRRINLLLDGMSNAFERVAKGLPYQLSWQGIMLGGDEASRQRRQFIVAQPHLNLSELSAGEVHLEKVHSIVKELGIDERSGLKVHITGDVALSHENLVEVKKTVGVATFVSLFLVALILYVGLGRSGRLVFASLATLVIGLIWTTGFAIAFIGSLNLISITFAVLFVGLGIDYSIQFCLRYRELIESGYHHRAGIVTTAKGVGRSLLVSCITIAIGFYSFVPTAYAGVGELGLISGTGMCISFFANLTLLPAFLTLFPLKKNLRPSVSARKKPFPYRYCRTVAASGAVLSLAAAAFMPKIYFDYNPLNLYDRKSEAITTIKELFKDPESSPWTISVLVSGEEETKVLAERLRKLKEVKRVITLFDFVADNQTEKLRTISDIALFLPPGLTDVRLERLRYEEGISALEVFERTLKKSSLSSVNNNPSALRLYDSIQRFKAAAGDSQRGEKAFASLEDALLSNLPSLFERVETLLQASSFDIQGLPVDLAAQYASVDGRYRIQVFPNEDLTNRVALERFVGAVRSIAPNATDAPVTIYESGMAVVSSFRQATLSALVAIAVYLLFESRSLFVTGLILAPLMAAMMLTGAVSVILGIPINFANVIVVPLLLGVGVHSSIIFILRHRTEPPEDGNMLKTSTARAIMLSTLTMLISASSLAFSAHRGIASMGMLLSICLGFLMLSTLVLLPTLLELSKRRLKPHNVDLLIKNE